MTLPNEGRTASGLFSFRLATAADADLLPRIARHCYGAWYDHLWRPGERDAYLDRTYAPEVVARELADPNVVYEFAYREDATAAGGAHAARRSTAARADDAVGFTKLELRRDLPGYPNAACLERVYVHPTAGRGLGTLLTERAFERGRADGRAFIWLRAMDSAARPIDRYRELGFRDVGGEVLDMPGMYEHYRGMRVMAREL